MRSVAVLFARRDSVYKTLPGTDVYDIDRNARTFRGGMPVVAHPPCRGWGKLFYFAKPEPGELDLGPFAVEHVRREGGVLEHPKDSKLWVHAQLPRPGEVDAWGGWTLPIAQHWWGHRAEKMTWLYIVGVSPRDIPAIPLHLGDATHVIAQSRVRRKDGKRLRKGMDGWRPEVSKSEREHTPPPSSRMACGSSQAHEYPSGGRVMTILADLHLYESEAERHAVCAELARMLRIVPLNLSSATASPSRDALDFPLDRAVAGDSINQGVIA